MINFYDFEVFKYNWLVVIINPFNKESKIIVDDKDELEAYYNEHKSDIWVGYNSRNYDVYILKAILLGFNPKNVSDFIIVDKRKGWEYSSLFKKLKLYNYDCLNIHYSLKQLEGFMGSSIKESEIPFCLERVLTPEEIDETIKYCTHDVEETMKVFLSCKGDFDVQLELMREFDLQIHNISKTQTQLVAEILEATHHEHRDDFNLTLQPYVSKIKKYKDVVDFYKGFITDEDVSDSKRDVVYSKKFKCEVAGVPHTFGWGGAHGAIKHSGTGYYLHIDVHQYYPSLVVSNGYFPRGVSEEGKRRYEMMKNESIRLKAFPELKNKRAGYKLCNNKMTGGMKDGFNKLYDPLNNNNIVVGGQLAILLLIEMLEPYVKLIQSNTDGIIVKLQSLDDYDVVDDICYEWETLTGVSLGFDPIITTIYQKDVNNYLFINEDGDVERIGGWLKQLNNLDYDLPIVNEALVNYMVNKVPVEKTVNSCDELKKFQKIVKVTDKFEFVKHNGIRYDYKCYRVFASKIADDGKLLKCKNIDGRVKADKFGNTPDHCFIENGDVNNAEIPRKLDKQYYINVAKDRLEKFGVSEV